MASQMRHDYEKYFAKILENFSRFDSVIVID